MPPSCNVSHMLALADVLEAWHRVEKKKIEINHLLLKTHNYKQVTSKHWDS